MEHVAELGFELPSPGSRRFRRELFDLLSRAILEGKVAAGVRLPASRSLAAQLGVSRNSVVAVYDSLAAAGLLTSRLGAGVFVVGRSPSATTPTRTMRSPAWFASGDPASPGDKAERSVRQTYRFDLRPGFPDTTKFPFEVWGRLVGRSLRAFSKSPASYRAPAGHPALRDAIARHLAASRNINCHSSQIIVTGGAQHGMSLLARTFAGPETAVAIERPGYPPTSAAFARVGASVVPIAVDRHGLRVEDISDDVRIVCLTPASQFPSGVPLSRIRRKQLTTLLDRTDAIAIEDDFGGEFINSRPGIASLLDCDPSSRVFQVGTFSMNLLPALRIGYIVAPIWAVPFLKQECEAFDWHGHAIEQGALASFISEGHLIRHIRKMRKIYRSRVELVHHTIARNPGILRTVPVGSGVNFALWPVREVEPTQMLSWQQGAADLGVGIDLLARYAPMAGQQPGFAAGVGLIATEQVEEAVAGLLEAFRTL